MKTQNIKPLIISILALALLIGSPAIAEEDGHEEIGHLHEETGHNDEKDNGHTELAGHEKESGEDKGHNDHGDHEEEGGVIKLTPDQVRQAGIETQVVKRRPGMLVVNAPGTVDFDAYKLADITTLVEGVIHARHVRLGDKVKKGQALVTLTSSALAQAEAEYLRAEAEHRKSKLDLERLEGLVKEKIVSQARFQQASSIHQSAHANLAASRASLSSYGLSGDKIDSLISAKEYGQLTLRAPVAGTIVADEFRTGQHVAAGARLIQIADESTVWVEVQLSQSQMEGITVGGSAAVTLKDKGTHYPAKVINVHHQLDKVTRTVGVRLEVLNPEDALHPGMFVNAEIEAGSTGEALLLPAQAIQRQGNELIVFIEEEPGRFERREVRAGKENLGLVPILEGVKEGEPVVVKGAFSLVSELAKSGFEVHNH